MSDTYFTYSNQNIELKYCLRCFFLTEMLAQLNGHCIERKVFMPTTIKSHMVKNVVTWSIRPDENNNIGLVYRGNRGLFGLGACSAVAIFSM